MSKKHHKPVHKKYHHKKIKSKINLTHIILSLLIIIGAIVIFNIFDIGSMIKQVDDNGLPTIKLNIIRDASCTECYGLITEIETIKAMDVNVDEKIIDYNSREARNLIDKYDIKKIPVILIFGDIEGLKVPNFERRDDALLLVRVLSPYIDTASGEVQGVVELIHIRKSDLK